MEILNQIFENFQYIDGITILNLKGDILFSAKFNNKLHKNSRNYEIIGKNFCEIYPKISKEESTLFQAMKFGKAFYIKNQKLEFYDGNYIYINSLSIPIRNSGQIVGALDISVENSNLISKKIEKNYIPIIESQFNETIRNIGNNSKRLYRIDDIITNNVEMIRMKKFIKEICDFDMSVLIYGETGTGKELVASSLHSESKRKDKPFIAQNCAAVPESLFESIFFGTTKGAYTDSVDNPGLFEMANGGTLFLDEINSMPLYLQSKLLRVIQDKKIRKVGSKKEIDVDVRLVIAMNKDPLLALEDKELRQDLYYRISMLKIDVLPLRKRKEDISLLTQYFITKYNKIFSKKIKGISQEIDKKFRDYDWLGNVRELDNLMLLAVSMIDENKEIIELKDLNFNMKDAVDEENNISINEIEKIGIKKVIEKYEKNLIRISLEKYNYNITHTAEALKMPRQTLQRKIKLYNL